LKGTRLVRNLKGLFELVVERGTLSREIVECIVEAAEDCAPNTKAIAYIDPLYAEDDRMLAFNVSEGLSGGVERVALTCEGSRVELLLFDRQLFESDVKGSALLELASNKLLLPYVAISGREYLDHLERLYKQRKIRESLSGLILEHPDLAHELLIDPRYFVQDGLMRLSHVIPQAGNLVQLLDGEDSWLLKSYEEAFRELASEGLIHLEDGYATIDKKLIEKTSRRFPSVHNQFARAQRLFRGFSKLSIGGTIGLLRLVSPRSSLEVILQSTLKSPDLPNPDKYLHFRTATGLARLSESVGLETMVSKIEASNEARNIELRRFGSVLNEVYLLRYEIDEAPRTVVVKRYPNWVSLKWAPLALWTLGTQNFAVLGRSRMEKECAAVSYLGRNGIPVPRILETSFADRTLIREYVEGENLADLIKQIIKGGRLLEHRPDIIGNVGGYVAEVHKVDATIGDCKAENFIVKDYDSFVALDLEQGGRGGNRAWDLAEFLYFSGHYADPLDPLDGIRSIVESFIEGYVKAGGDSNLFSEVSKLKYAKTFTPITLPNVLYAISQTCRRRK